MKGGNHDRRRTTLRAADALGWTLLHFCWQATIVALLLACVLNLLPLRASKLRYAAACAALACLAALPLITFAVLLADQHVAPRQLIIAVPAANPRTAPYAGFPKFGEPWSVRCETALNHGLPVVVGFWLTGVLIFLCRLNLGLVATARWKSTGVEPVASDLEEALRALRLRLGIEQAVKLLNSARVYSPTVIGWMRPVILLPLGCMTGLSQIQIEAIFAHELAHVRRHDYLVNLLQSVLETLLFYHPAVWWVSAQVRYEREHCCDDLAVAITGDRLSYASALSCLEERRTGPSPVGAFAATGGVLKMRIARVLGLNDVPAFPRTAAIALLALAGTAAGLIAFGAAHAQSAPSRQDSTSSKAASNEIGDPYKTWLDQEVRWIITPEEREEFVGLANNRDRDEFIERFWQKRNPKPGSYKNALRVEHYRRIAYTNMHFAGGEPGWETDRGHVYIVFGPPDSIDSHPAGGNGSAQPFETWHYRSIEVQEPMKSPNGSGYTGQSAVKKDFNFRFVDECNCGRYSLQSLWPLAAAGVRGNDPAAATSAPQSPARQGDAGVQLHKLNIVSEDLLKSEQLQKVQKYQGSAYPLQVLLERIRQDLRDRGYANAWVEILEPAPAASDATPPMVDVSVRVSAGAKYTLSGISVEGAQAFSQNEIRQQFPLHSGDLFSSTAIGEGLDRLKHLYEAKGYFNLGVIPRLQMDDIHHTVTLILDIKEGKVTAA